MRVLFGLLDPIAEACIVRLARNIYILLGVRQVMIGEHWSLKSLELKTNGLREKPNKPCTNHQSINNRYPEPQAQAIKRNY